MFNKLTQFVAAFLLLVLGSWLARAAGMPLVGEQLVATGAQVAMAKIAPAQTPKATAQAGTWGLQVHVASVQPSQRAGVPWNGSNDGFAVRYALDGTYAVQAGHYRNEHTVQGYNFFTNYVYGDYTPLHYGPLRLGAFAGVVSGYDDFTTAGGKVTSMTEVGLAPKAGLVARYQWRALNATLRLSPAMRHAGPAALGVEVGFDF